MFRDPVFEFLKLNGMIWIGIAIAFGLFNILYDTLMSCLIVGIRAVIRDSRAVNRRNITFRRIAWFVKQNALSFRSGAQEGLKDYRSDPLAFIWPFTVLAIPIAIYGITRSSVANTSDMLLSTGLALDPYRWQLFSFLDIRIAWIILGVAVISETSSFIRYRQRSKPLWFAKYPLLQFSRILLFNLPIFYAAANIVLIWIDFTIGLSGSLLDNGIQYQVLHPDLMYGLRPVYNELLGISILLLFLSLLPTILLLREKKEKYSWIYYALLYGGVVILILLFGYLVYLLDQRLGMIQQVTLGEIGNQLHTVTDFDERGLLIDYYSLVSTLPNSFPIPFWFEYVAGARILLFVYELFVMFSPKADQLSVRDVLTNLLKKAD